jgi:hypothetical protein
MTCCGRVSALAALPYPALFVTTDRQTDTMFAFIYRIWQIQTYIFLKIWPLVSIRRNSSAFQTKKTSIVCPLFVASHKKFKLKNWEVKPSKFKFVKLLNTKQILHMFIDFVSLKFVALIFNVECAYKKSKLFNPTYYLEYLANAY